MAFWIKNYKGLSDLYIKHWFNFLSACWTVGPLVEFQAIARKSVSKNSISRMSPACFCNLTRYFCWLFYWEEYKWSGFSSFQFIFLFYLKRSFLSSFFINKLGTILGLSFWGLLSRTFPSRLLNRACVRNFKLGMLPSFTWNCEFCGCCLTYRLIPKICEWDEYHKFAFDVVTFVPIKIWTLS